MVASSRIVDGLREPYQRKLARSILKTDSADRITDLANSIVSSHLGWDCFTCFHFELSVGAVLGISRDDERCLVKFFGPDSTLSDLVARTNFQSWLCQQGYPCPNVIVYPTVSDQIVFLVEEYIDTGRRADGHRIEDRELMAAELARLIQLGNLYPLAGELPLHALEVVPKSPWPKPHNVLFDFEATKKGAEWIDAIGQRYQPLLASDCAPRKIGHMDWGAKHCRVDGSRISAIYDWDSVARLPETEIVGKAAVNFTASWYVEGKLRPSIEEMVSFVGCYEKASSKKFSDHELEMIVAAIKYGAGYGARCEYANVVANGADSSELREFLSIIESVDLLSVFLLSHK